MKLRLDPRVVDLVHRVSDLFPVSSDQWAVGGAIAMAAHGVRRHTDDVDLFVTEELRLPALRELRLHGVEMRPVFTPHHYVGHVPEHQELEISVDLLIPAADPDESAIYLATIVEVESRRLRVFTPEWLVLTKFYSTQPGARDDIHRMLQAGIVDMTELMRLARLLDEKDAGELAAVIKSFSRVEPRRLPPRGAGRRRS